MKKIILMLVFSFVSLPSFGSLVCSNTEVLYTENLQAFGFPQVPMGTPMGYKRVVYKGDTIASKDFVVEDSNNWMNFEDWKYTTELANKNIIWDSSQNRYERIFTSTLTVIDKKSGTEILSKQEVLCHVNEAPSP